MESWNNPRGMLTCTKNWVSKVRNAAQDGRLSAGRQRQRRMLKRGKTRILGYETRQCNSRAQRSTVQQKQGKAVDEEPRAASEALACLLVCLRRSSKSRDLGVVDAVKQKVRADSLDSTVPLTREYNTDGRKWWIEQTLASLPLGGLSLRRSLRRGMNEEK